MIGKLPIYRDLFRLTTDLLNELDNLPKKYRYSVGDRIISTSLETLHHLHAAYGAQDAQARIDAMDRFAEERVFYAGVLCVFCCRLQFHRWCIFRTGESGQVSILPCLRVGQRVVRLHVAPQDRDETQTK